MILSGVSFGNSAGVTGVRFIIFKMKKRNFENSFATLCVGGDIGTAVVIEV